jgi:hypothetical protein
MTNVPKGNAPATVVLLKSRRCRPTCFVCAIRSPSVLPHGKVGIIVQQLSRRIGSISQRVGAQLMKVRRKLKRMDEVDRLHDQMLQDIGLKRINFPGGTRFVRWD